ncbi:Aldehyde dehydrogenase mitochondrial, partial [Schistosoma japonicum]
KLDELANYESVLCVASVTRYYAEYLMRVDDMVGLLSSLRLFTTLRKATGVVAFITSESYSFLSCISKVVPCLCTGYTIMLKPVLRTLSFSIFLMRLIEAAVTDFRRYSGILYVSIMYRLKCTC